MRELRDSAYSQSSSRMASLSISGFVTISKAFRPHFGIRTRWFLFVSNRVRFNITDRRFVGRPVSEIIDRVNAAMLNWARYYRHGTSSRQFNAVRSYAQERLAVLISIKLEFPPPTGHIFKRRCL